VEGFLGILMQTSLVALLRSYQAEVVGALRAIKVSKERHWNNLWLETYSLLLVAAFKKDIMIPCTLKKRWNNALLVTRYMNFMVTHTYREGNHLAILGLTLTDIQNLIRAAFINKRPNTS
jgi:hypothetical protein